MGQCNSRACSPSIQFTVYSVHVLTCSPSIQSTCLLTVCFSLSCLSVCFPLLSHVPHVPSSPSTSPALHPTGHRWYECHGEQKVSVALAATVADWDLKRWWPGFKSRLTLACVRTFALFCLLKPKLQIILLWSQSLCRFMRSPQPCVFPSFPLGPDRLYSIIVSGRDLSGNNPCT